MADYYSNSGRKTDQYLDYDTGTGFGWIWAIVALVAVVALFAIGTSGGGGDGASVGVEGAAPADTTTIEAAPATAEQ